MTDLIRTVFLSPFTVFKHLTNCEINHSDRVVDLYLNYRRAFRYLCNFQDDTEYSCLVFHRFLSLVSTDC